MSISLFLFTGHVQNPFRTNPANPSARVHPCHGHPALITAGILPAVRYRVPSSGRPAHTAVNRFFTFQEFA
jgi:hypothetical protein